MIAITFFIFFFLGRNFSNNVAVAHRSLPQGVTCGNQFNSPSTALPIPNTRVSWASYRIMSCDQPITWAEGSFSQGQSIKFTVGVPRLERFADVRMNVLIIGANLPLLTTEGKNELPQAIVDEIGENGAVLFEAPEDQSNCDHITSENMELTSSVVDGRCLFREEFGDSYSWVMLDDELLVNATGIFRMALYNRKKTSSKAWFACCDWPEDFGTPYDLPENICPYCGTDAIENRAWADFFYEQKTMADYGGYPSNETCVELTTTQEPSEEQCPPEDDGSPGEYNPNCVLHCSGGSCHSHNIFGGCVFEIDWMIPEPRLPGSGTGLNSMVLFTGDSVKFKAADQFPHNIYEFSDRDAVARCDFSTATQRANIVETNIGHVITFTDPGEYIFSCNILCQNSSAPPCHCSLGQKLVVEVKDVSEGKFCHSHFYIMPEEVTPTTCLDSFVLVSSVGDGTYAPSGLCAEFCMPENALPPQLELSSCASLGYDSFVLEQEVTPPLRRLQSTLVKLYARSGKNECHCHSFENITCDASGDDLYDEHIQEITEFCQGIFNGTEDSCPYNCFQPFEILHLHYLLCDLRTPDPLFLLINQTEKCHLAARSNDGSECESAPPSEKRNDLDVGPSSCQIAGAVVGAVVVVGIIIAAAAFLISNHKVSQKPHPKKKLNESQSKEVEKTHTEDVAKF